jgi:diguanylate cyclase (GGDEF)-like protein
VAAARDASALERDELAASRERDMTASERADVSAQNASGLAERAKLARELSSSAREAAAEDRAAAARDRASAAEDRAAAASLDSETAKAAALASGDDARSELEARALPARALAASAREAAAGDRAAAARDRVSAAADRAVAHSDREFDGIDELTGALHRGAGLAAMRRERERSLRTGQPLTVAFINVVGLKAVNDERGPNAGDDLLHSVARCVTKALRAYDAIVRYSSDEFVCAFAGASLDLVRERFERVSAELAKDHDGARISVGVAQVQVQEQEAVENAIARADAAMIGERRPRA